MVERLQRAVPQNLVVPKIEYKMDKIFDHPWIKGGNLKAERNEAPDVKGAIKYTLIFTSIYLNFVD